jgi:hypothetical protein
VGYDMYIENTPADEAAKAAEAEAAFDTAVKARDALTVGREHPTYVDAQAAVKSALRTLQAADTGYFQLNIWGMSQYRDVMRQLGMVMDDYNLPPWPHEPDGLTYQDIKAAEAPADGTSLPVKSEAVAYVKQRDAHLAWHPEPVFGIALHKFGSNDGWLVTPVEITAALESYRMHHAEEVRVLLGDHKDEPGYWLKWIAYLNRAQRRSGFRVY